MKKLTLFTLLSFLPSLGFAFGVTWEGQITDNVDTPVNTHMSGATTTIRFSIWDDTGSVCELYQEEHNVDLTATNGFVSVEIGTGTPTGGSPAFSEAIFSNANNPITGVAACTYNPTALVGRKMDITLDPNSAGVGAEVFATQIDISLLPAAVYAKEASQANTIVANGVTTASILDGTITSVDLSAGAVDSAAILDGTITNADMAVDSITSAEILDGTITFADVDSSFQSALTTGTTAQYFRGDLSLATLDTLAVPENTNLYFTDARALNATLTGFTSGPGAITAADTILSAIQKLDGNSGGGGEVNTASNSGIGGVGVYVIKTGANLEFRNINAGASGTITVTDDSANSEIDLEVTASSIDSSHIVDASIQGLDIGTQQLNELHFQGVPGACTAGQGLASDGAGNFSCTNLGDFSTTGGTMTGNIDMGVNSIQNMNTIEGALGAVGFPTYTFTGDLDTGIYSPAIDNLGFVTAGQERISISPTGEVGIGTGTPAASLHVMGGWPIFESNSNDNIGSGLVLEKSRSAASVQMDDELGSIEWKGHDGTTPITGAYIQAEVDGAVSGGQMPTRMVFNTRDYGGVLDTRMSIMPDGQVYAGAMKADTNAPAAGFGCTFMSTDACQCNFDYTFIDYDQNGMINTDECVEPGLIVDPLESTKVNGFLTVGLEVNYDGAQSTQCAPGFTWYDDDNSGTVNAAAGECVRYDLDAGDGHVSAFESFNVGDNVLYSHCTGTYVEGSCDCGPGYNWGDMNQNGNLDIGECRSSIFSASTKHGVSIASIEDDRGPEFTSTCPGAQTPGTCACYQDAFWKDKNTDGNLDTDECFVGGMHVDGQAQFSDGLYMKGGIFYRKTFNATAGAGIDTEYNRARGNESAPAGTTVGDVIATHRYKAHDGTQMAQSAQIKVSVDTGTPTTNMPGKIEFSTADGSTMNPQLSINSEGTVKIEKLLQLTPYGAPPVTCDGTKNGVVAYNSSGGKLCICDGTAWSGVSGAGCTGW